MSNKRSINPNSNPPAKKIKTEQEEKNNSATNTLAEYTVQVQDPRKPVSPLVKLFSQAEYIGYDKFFFDNIRQWLEDRDIEVVSSLCKRFRQIIPRYVMNLTKYFNPKVDISNSLLYSITQIKSEERLTQRLSAIDALKRERPTSTIQVTSADIHLEDSIENVVSMISRLHSENISADISLKIHSKEQLMAIVVQLKEGALMNPKPCVQIWNVTILPEAYKDVDELQAILENLPMDIEHLAIYGAIPQSMTMLNLSRFPSLQLLYLMTVRNLKRDSPLDLKIQSKFLKELIIVDLRLLPTDKLDLTGCSQLETLNVCQMESYQQPIIIPKVLKCAKFSDVKDAGLQAKLELVANLPNLQELTLGTIGREGNCFERPGIDASLPPSLRELSATGVFRVDVEGLPELHTISMERIINEGDKSHHKLPPKVKNVTITGVGRGTILDLRSCKNLESLRIEYFLRGQVWLAPESYNSAEIFIARDEREFAKETILYLEKTYGEKLEELEAQGQS